MNKFKTKVYEVNAFTSVDERPFNKEPIGNPAAICIVDDFPINNIMANAGIKTASPMTVFTRPVDIEKHIFEIRYASPNGTMVNLCGHATVATTEAIKKLYDWHDGEITFMLDKHFNVNETNSVKSIINDNKITLVFPSLGLNKVEDDVLLGKFADSLRISKNDIVEIYHGELNDYLVRLNSAKTLREMNPDFDRLMSFSCKGKYAHRALLATAASDIEDYDFQSRVFAVSLGVNEDIACGSANCSITPYWSKILNKDKMKMLYPYHAAFGSDVGGIQEVIYDEHNRLVHIISEGSIVKEYMLQINAVS